MTEHRLAATFVELAAVPDDVTQTPRFLDRFATLTAQLLGVRAAVAVLAERRGEQAVAGSGTPGLAELELEAGVRGEGPGLLCMRRGREVPEVGLAGAVARQRWPYYAPRAAQQFGCLRAGALPLRHGDETLGALVLFFGSEPSLDPAALGIAGSLAEAAAISLARGRELAATRTLATQLQQALSSRVVIEQAKGVLAARLSITVDESFQLLRGHARSARRPLADVAHEVVAGALRIELPGPRRGRRD
ncbi:GAF and ANTAR domain-containing protein [Streptomyces sp. NPDC051940]|uniref:GAF and ANTAR domain-containing protein n=1 Tax=Streptomyces sp. NPDC051940 TaxID=3155675 RepID=UPI0034404DCD